MRLSSDRASELVRYLVNDFLPDLVFQKLSVARATQHSRFQDFMLFPQEFPEFNSQLFDVTVLHVAFLAKWEIDFDDRLASMPEDQAALA